MRTKYQVVFIYRAVRVERVVAAQWAIEAHVSNEREDEQVHTLLEGNYYAVIGTLFQVSALIEFLFQQSGWNSRDLVDTIKS